MLLSIRFAYLHVLYNIIYNNITIFPEKKKINYRLFNYNVCNIVTTYLKFSVLIILYYYLFLYYVVQSLYLREVSKPRFRITI